MEEPKPWPVTRITPYKNTHQSLNRRLETIEQFANHSFQTLLPGTSSGCCASQRGGRKTTVSGPDANRCARGVSPMAGRKTPCAGMGDRPRAQPYVPGQDQTHGGSSPWVPPQRISGHQHLNKSDCTILGLLRYQLHYHCLITFHKYLIFFMCIELPYRHPRILSLQLLLFSSLSLVPSCSASSPPLLVQLFSTKSLWLDKPSSHQCLGTINPAVDSY